MVTIISCAVQGKHTYGPVTKSKNRKNQSYTRMCQRCGLVIYTDREGNVK